MSNEIPSAIQLIQQWLHENGYPNTLKEFETECALKFDPEDVQMGGHLETILSEYSDMRSAATVSDAQREGKLSLEKLLEPGAGDYVKKGASSFSNVHKANVLSVSFNHDPENMYMASGSTDKSIKLFTIPKNPEQDVSGFEPEILGEFTPHNGAVISLDFNPKFKNLLVSSSMDGTVAVTDVDSKKVLQTFRDHTKYVVQVKWHSDGVTFACASHDHSASIYRKDETEGIYKLIEKLPFNGNAEALAFSPDNKLILSIREDNNLHIYDLATSTKSKFNMNAKEDDHVSFTALHMQFSPDGEYLLVSTDKDRLILYRMSSGSVPVRNFYGANNDIYSQPRCCWHPSGKYVYSTSQDNKIYCWEVATQKIVTKLEGHKGVVRDLAHHPSLNLLGSSSFDKTIKLWSQ